MQDPNEDTEWNQVLREKGIIPERPKEPEITEEALVEMIEQAIAEKTGEKKLEDRSLEELDELDDEMDDDGVIAAYRRQRMQEIKEAAKKSQFGNILEISADEFIKEVTEACQNVGVVVHLYKPGLEACQILNSHLQILANKYKSVKFVSIISDKCIPNYPDKNVPTLLLYMNGDVCRQAVGLAALGGLNMQTLDLELFLAESGVLSEEDFEVARQQWNHVQRTHVTRYDKQNKHQTDSDSD